MRKIFYAVLSLVVFSTASGFSGCSQSFYNLVYSILSAYYEDPRPITGNSSGTENHGIAVGESGVILTSDGRPPAAWILRPSGTTQRLNAVKIKSGVLTPDAEGVVDSVTAYAIGNNSTVLRSTDRGYIWQNRSIPGEYSNLYGLDLVVYSPTSGVHAVVCGDSGLVYRSSNSGSNFVWLYYNVGANRKLNSIACVNHAVWAAVGDNGAVYRTINGGEVWENRSISSSISLYKVVTPRYDRYCAVGTGGAIYTSSDYGNSWAPRSSGTTAALRDVLFTSVDSGVAVGDNGVVRHTTNGGVTWLADSYFNGITTRNIISIAKVDGNTVNSITRSSTIDNSGADTTFFAAVSTEPFIGIEPISNFIADIFSLKQNYPNPFNPVTNIEISIPQNSLVKLIIYNVQGKETEILVNRELNAGSYKIDWNAANYPSGVYFYKITAGDYKETKKMVLVK